MHDISEIGITEAATAVRISDSDTLDARYSKSGSPEDPSELQPGAVVGRYVLLDKLGAGGMGVVYAAYDPELARKVALKLVLPAPAHSRIQTEGHTRLLREAQALAQLSHPNVVAVHDVGSMGERVWLAMEYVEGLTLDVWTTKNQRSWGEILTAMTAAGDGLAAAHASGLLHRDFKPENVMMGADGRVRVMDFGLARTGQKDENSLDFPLENSAFSVELTRVGAIMGTPAYMAPEQFLGLEVSQAADQFAYCVTLWELLYQQRPFPGDTYQHLARSVLDHDLQSPPRRNVPRWIHAVCVRGLQRNPETRFSSMAELLEALQVGQRRSKRNRLTLAAGFVAVVGAGAIGINHLAHTRANARCQQSGAAIEAVWNPDIEQQMHSALLATGEVYADATIPIVTQHLGNYAHRWRTARTEACLATEVTQEWEPQTLEQATWCLDEHYMEFDALVDALLHADTHLMRRALSAVAQLPRSTSCIDRDWLRRTTPPPAETRSHIHPLRRMLAQARALEAGGDYEASLQLAQQGLNRATELGWKPLVAAAHLRVGLAQDQLGHYDDSLTSLTQSYFTAAQAQLPEIAISAASQIVYTLGQQSKPEQALLWGQLAEIEHGRLATELRSMWRPPLDSNLAAIQEHLGNYDQAGDLYQRALSGQAQLQGADHPDLGMKLNNLANIERRLGNYDQAEAYLERAIRIWEASLGPNHPDLAFGLNSLGAVYHMSLRYELATTYYRRALEIRERVLGPDHVHVGRVLNNLADVYTRMKRYEEAGTILERTIEIWKAKLGPDHPNLAVGYNNLASVKLATKDPEGAAPLARLSLEIREQAFGSDHPDVAKSLGTLAQIMRAQGHYEEATNYNRRALSVTEKALGVDHVQTTQFSVLLAELAILQEDPETAIKYAERSLKLLENATNMPTGVALAKWSLARALAPNERKRARTLAMEASVLFDADGQPDRSSEIKRWLQEHP